MRTLLVIDNLGSGGAQRQMTNLAVGLARRQGNDLALFTYYPHDHFLPTIRAARMDYICAPKRSRFDPQPLLALARTIASFRPDSVLAFLRTPSLYAELARLRSPRTRLVVSERSGLRDGRLTLGDTLAGIAHVAADAVTVNSRAYRDALVARLPFLQDRARVVYNGVDQRFFDAFGARGTTPARATLRLAVIAGRCTPEKGALTLAAALGIATRAGLAVELDWIGGMGDDHAHQQQVHAAIEAEKLQRHWRWCGPSRDVAAALPAYDALVIPSLYEGVANVLCEAMAFGLPVISTDAGDHAEILERGRTGLVVPRGDAAALASAIAGFAAMAPDERAALARRGHERARALFSLDAYLDAYQHLLDGR